MKELKRLQTKEGFPELICGCCAGVAVKHTEQISGWTYRGNGTRIRYKCKCHDCIYNYPFPGEEEWSGAFSCAIHGINNNKWFKDGKRNRYFVFESGILALRESSGL